MAILQTSSDLSDCFFEKLEIIFEIDWRKKIEISSNTFREKSFKVILGEKVNFQKIATVHWNKEMRKFSSEKSYNCVRCAQKKFEPDRRQKIILTPKQVNLEFRDLTILAWVGFSRLN